MKACFCRVCGYMFDELENMEACEFCNAPTLYHGRCVEIDEQFKEHGIGSVFEKIEY